VPLLRAAAFASAWPPTVESDDYLPLKIVWVPVERRRGIPLTYLRISGTFGGELEIRINPTTGEVLTFTVLAMGPGLVDTSADGLNEVESHGVAILDSWHEGVVASDDRSVFEFESPFRAGPIPGGMRIDFDQIQPTRMIRCSPAVALATDDDDCLASVVAIIPIDARHFQR
jgi:hypothetical protein